LNYRRLLTGLELQVEDAKRASESADAEAKALQLQLDEARLLAAEASEKSPTGGTMGGTASDMCGSQNVSGPEIAGPGVGAAHAAAAATSQGTGGHGAPAPEQSVASSQAAEKTADPKEQIAYLLRLGLNRREVCVGHMPLERVAVVFAAHSRLASSA
jgi:hypothetical protein